MESDSCGYRGNSLIPPDMHRARLGDHIPAQREVTPRARAALDAHTPQPTWVADISRHARSTHSPKPLHRTRHPTVPSFLRDTRSEGNPRGRCRRQESQWLTVRLHGGASTLPEPGEVHRRDENQHGCLPGSTARGGRERRVPVCEAGGHTDNNEDLRSSCPEASAADGCARARKICCHDS